MREELPHRSQRQVEKPTGVDFESTDNRRQWTVLPTSVVDSPMSGARARGDVDERGNSRVISGLRNDRPSITMADKHDRT